jgi:predicted outer membrane repeat protein
MFRARCVLALLAMSAALTSIDASAGVCRVAVDGSAGQDGLMWTTAKDLHGALADTGCSELWLKQGVYLPTTPSGTPTTADQAVTFQISRDLLLYGGFAGGEDHLDERDPALHRTILSGDIGGDDTDPDANGIIETSDDIVGKNSFHVVTMGGQDGSSVTAATLLDGITITAGYTLGAPIPYGGGLLCWAYAPDAVCSPRLNDVDFRGNLSGQYGGGMLAWAYGTDSDSSPSLTRVRFSGNSGRNGGGMANMTSGDSNSPNHLNRSSPSLADVSFIGNSGTNGAGMLSQASGQYATVSPTLSRVTFSGNAATGNGGGMYVDAHGLNAIVDPVLGEVTFSNNSATVQNGGAMYFFLVNAPTGDLELHPVLHHVTFANNSAARGGAVANEDLGGNNNFSPEFSHVIFWGNHASSADDDINFDWVVGAFFEYTIMAGGCVPVDDGHSLITCGDGNSTADPLLGPLQDNGGFTQTHLPAPGSPAIDAGDPANCSGVDQRGVPRPQGPRCDIGSVEVQPSDNDRIFADGFEN